MKILITGSNGVIGKEIAQRLKKNKKNKLTLLGKKKDLTKQINLNLKPELVIHCAAKHPFSKKGVNMRNIYSTNMKITKNIIKFCNENGVKKVIYLSAILVYGLIKKKIVSESQTPINPNLYGKSKFLSEKLFCKKNNKFKTICLRIPGVFTLDLTKDHPLIIKILKKIIKNKDIHIYNYNKKFNNICDSEEIVKFINIILKNKNIQNGIYNFSSSRPIRFIQVIKLMKKIFNSHSRIINKKIDKKSFIISNKKIKNDFNLKISTTKNIVTRCCQQILKKNIYLSNLS